MAILAADDAAYDLYARQIRAEYIHVPLDLYKSGRAAILQNFIKQSAFLTPLFKEQYAEQSVKNMTREIAWLPSLEQ